MHYSTAAPAPACLLGLVSYWPLASDFSTPLPAWLSLCELAIRPFDLRESLHAAL